MSDSSHVALKVSIMALSQEGTRCQQRDESKATESVMHLIFPKMNNDNEVLKLLEVKHMG